MDRSYATCIRYLRLLIARAGTLSDRSRHTTGDEWRRLKRGALTCLGLLGRKVEKVYRRTAETEFLTHVSAGRLRDDMSLLDDRAYESLDHMLFLLRAALREAQDAPAAVHPHATKATVKFRVDLERTRKTSYSPADKEAVSTHWTREFCSSDEPGAMEEISQNRRGGTAAPDAARGISFQSQPNTQASQSSDVAGDQKNSICPLSELAVIRPDPSSPALPENRIQ